jgi:DNA-binding transcriptional regulator YdaS (Cro superfamily)
MPANRKRDTALTMAIQAAGGPVALAEFIRKKYGPISIQAVHKWKRCPPLRVLQVEAATGGVVSRFRLRPDLYR